VPRAASSRRCAMQPADMAPMFGESWSDAESHTFAQLLIDCEEDGTLRAVLVGILRETER
jgi:hypothetical protein